MRLAQNTAVRAWYVKPCINQYRADWLKLCDERLHKIHSNKLNLVHSLHTPQTTTSETEHENQHELTTKAKKGSRADFLDLRSFFQRKNCKKRMTFICGLAIILPIYAIQNQEMPEVEMFCRHTIGGYQFEFVFMNRKNLIAFLECLAMKILASVIRENRTVNEVTTI